MAFLRWRWVLVLIMFSSRECWPLKRREQVTRKGIFFSTLECLPLGFFYLLLYWCWACSWTTFMDFFSIRRTSLVKVYYFCKDHTLLVFWCSYESRRQSKWRAKLYAPTAADESKFFKEWYCTNLSTARKVLKNVDMEFWNIECFKKFYFHNCIFRIIKN